MEQSDDPPYQQYLLSNKIGHGTYVVVFKATCAKTWLEEAVDAVAGCLSFAVGHPALDFLDLAKVLRRGYPNGVPMQNKYCVVQGLWKGVGYMHSIELLVSRDIKPADCEIVVIIAREVRARLAFGTKVREVLVDMGLASTHVKPNIVVGDQRASCMYRTAEVCTSCYVAPGFLCAHHSGEDTQNYGCGLRRLGRIDQDQIDAAMSDLSLKET